ncbi:MAG: polysaccharide biosynthesis protein [Clostridia bacterium]|nr:polysaccharide biosynthesis protein [Clostridia bacterium]
MKASDSLTYNTIILTTAGLINRILGFGFRIIIVRLLGPEIVGLYEQVFSAFTVVLVLSTAGLPTGIAKIVAQETALGHSRRAWHSFLVATVLVSVSSLLLTVPCIMFNRLLTQVFADSRVSLALLIACIAVPVVAASSCVRALFQGLNNMIVPVLAQISEQVLRIIVSLYLALQLGVLGPSLAAAGLAIGLLIGEASGLVLMLLLGHGEIAKLYRTAKPTLNSSSHGVVGQLLSFAAPVGLVKIIASILLLAQSIIIPWRLQACGLSGAESIQLFGQLSGAALVLINLPSVLTFAMSTALLSGISKTAASGRSTLLRARITEAVRLTMIIGLPVAAFLFFAADPLCDVVFRLPQAGTLLQLLAPAAPFFYLEHVTGAILEGLGAVRPVLANRLAGYGITLIGLYTLTSLPGLGIHGSAVSISMGWLVIALLDLTILHQMDHAPNWHLLAIKPLIATFGTATAIYAARQLLSPATVDLFLFLAITSVAAITIYCGILVLLGELTWDDLRRIPGLNHLPIPR